MSSQRIFCLGGCGASITVEGASPQFRYTCAQCAPQDKRANAAKVPRNSVPAEVRDYAEHSGASVPDNTPLTTRERNETTIEVETSGGTAEAATRRNDLDDITADDIGTDKIKRVPARPDRPKIPRYLKTVPSPVVPTTNPDAPFGYDLKTDLPIKPLRLGAYDSLRCVEAIPEPSAEELEWQRKLDEERNEERKRAEELREREKREQFDRDLERLKTHFRESANMKGIPSSRPEPELTGWGFERRKHGAERIGDPIDVFSRRHYPTLLGLTRPQLFALFDGQVGVEDVTVVDPTQEPSKIVIPEKRVVLASPHLVEMTEELKGIDEEIASREKLLATYKVASEKRAIKRGEISPESARDAKTFKRLRDEEGPILERLRKRRHALKDKVNAEAARLHAFAHVTPARTIEVLTPMTVQRPVLFRDVFDAPATFDYSSYLDALKRNDTHAFINFENEIAVQALAHRVLPLPSGEILQKFLPYDVTRIVNCITGVVHDENTEPEEEDDDGDHDPREIALTLKQGGANFDGQVYGAGTDDKGRKRKLSGFTKVLGKWRRGDREAGEHSEHGAGDDGEAHEPD